MSSCLVWPALGREDRWPPWSSSWSYRRLHQNECPLGLVEGDLVDKSLQDFDCLCVVGQVQFPYWSVPTHHVYVAEIGCSSGQESPYPVNKQIEVEVQAGHLTATCFDPVVPVPVQSELGICCHDSSEDWLRAGAGGDGGEYSADVDA